MVRRVYEGATKSALFDAVLVATDDERVRRTVQGFGGTVVMTRTDHASGTDRVAEVARTLDADLVVNIQGDLPFVGRSLLEPAVTPLVADESIPMGTLAVPISDAGRWLDPNVVKVVTDEAGFALYFSRAPIPARRSDVANGEDTGYGLYGWQHVGLYVYRREFLLRFATWSTTPLERLERLEQLRVLEHGERLHVARTSERVIEVDTEEDLKRARDFWRAQGTSGEVS